tara:strand:- start:3955 stop:4122 length:168 start_codon:yes stop_codon:yes gene_type:complete
MITIFKYFQKITDLRKQDLNFEEKYLAKSVDLYDLERRQKELDIRNTSNFNIRLR